jgi:hypothetical protein|tara:strand:+ start:300 stop:632 length:333 start_codon:yes stop_codon:yes gene_type:complete
MSISDATPQDWDARQRATRNLEHWERQEYLDPFDTKDPSISDGSTASYYELPKAAAELQDLISAKNMNAQIGEIFRSCYRYGEVSHSDMLRDAKKMKFYAEAEIKRLELK